MKINRDEHPRAKFRIGEDDMVHIVDSFGDPWCEDEIGLVDDVDGDVGRHDLCPECYQAGLAEEAFLDG